MVVLTKQVSLNNDEYKENATYYIWKKKKSADFFFASTKLTVFSYVIMKHINNAIQPPHNLHTLF